MYPRTNEKSSESQRVISLNVGGQLFTASLATLKAVPESTLAIMFSGAGLAKMAVDEAGRFFIDRDPKVNVPPTCPENFALPLSSRAMHESYVHACSTDRKHLQHARTSLIPTFGMRPAP